jgi:hypothetical protein
LAAFRFIGGQLTEAIMSKKLEESKSKACVGKRCLSKPVSIIARFFETVWAMGAGVAAAMIISTSTLRARCANAPRFLFLVTRIEPTMKSWLVLQS